MRGVKFYQKWYDFAQKEELWIINEDNKLNEIIKFLKEASYEGDLSRDKWKKQIEKNNKK